MAFKGRSVRPGDASPFDRDGLFFDMDGRRAGLRDGGGCTGAGGGGAGTDAALYLVPLSQQNFASDSFFVPHSGAGQNIRAVGGELCLCKTLPQPVELFKLKASSGAKKKGDR